MICTRRFPIVFFFGVVCWVGLSGAGYAGIAGTGSVSGGLTAPQPLTAIQVYARNLDKRMLYMVWSKAGRYEVVNLMPGAYEVWAEKKGYRSGVQKAQIAAGTAAKIDLALNEGKSLAAAFGATDAKERKTVASYDELYPPGPGRDIAENKCMACHMQNFLPTHQWNRQQWEGAIDMMMSPNFRRGQIMSPGTIDKVSDQERATLAEYLSTHFGPNSETRFLKPDVEYPMDEQVLSRAMYIEYWPPAQAPASLPSYAKDMNVYVPRIGNDGTVWFTSRLPGLGKLDPTTAEFSFYPYPDPKIFGHDLTVDRQGMVFAAEFQGFHLTRYNPETKKMDRFPMDEKGVIKNGQGHTPDYDSKGNIWFSVITGNSIGMWDRKTERTKLWQPPTPNSFPYGFIVDKNDKIWFAELNACNVGYFDPATEQFKEYPSLSKPCKMRKVAAGDDGIIWYSVTSRGKLGRLDPKTGKQTEYDILPAKSKTLTSIPYGIITDRNNHVWMGDDALGGALIRFDPATQKFTYYPVPRPTDIPYIDASRDGAIVFSARNNPQTSVGILYPDVSTMKTFAIYR